MPYRTRSHLTIADLKGRTPSSTRLMNVKVPAALADAIEQLARKLGASKTEVVIALLNEGLDRVRDGHKR